MVDDDVLEGYRGDMGVGGGARGVEGGGAIFVWKPVEIYEGLKRGAETMIYTRRKLPSKRRRNNKRKEVKQVEKALGLFTKWGLFA